MTGLSLPEGPTFDRDGNLYVVEIPAGRVTRIAPDGTGAIFATTGGGPNGLALGPAGQLWVANSGGLTWGEVAERPGFVRYGRIDRIHPDGSVSELIREIDGRPLLGPNDIVSGQDGDIWFTDPGGPNSDIVSKRGRVCWVASDGTGARVAGEGFQYPNGLALRAGDRELIVAETGSGTLWLHEVRGPGSLGERHRWAQMPDGHLPDGMCFDSAGRLLVAGNGGAAVVVFDENGAQLDRMPMPDGFVTNLAFAPGRPLLYVTFGRLGGAVVAMPWESEGAPLPGWNARLS